MRRAFEVLAVVGTRPEAVKTAPLVLRLRREPGVCVRLCASGQHRDLLDDALAAFALRPDARLAPPRAGRNPTGVLASVSAGVDALLARRAPDLVLVQGDTTTTLAAALAAFHRRVPVAHLEAGLRTGDLAAPFPEELNRVAVDRLASLHFAPTDLARRRLLEEGREAKTIFVTGNTAVDALKFVLASGGRFDAPLLRALPADRPWAVLTLHRRETHGAALRGMIGAILNASRRRPEFLWVCPVHPNPAVRSAFARLKGKAAFVLTPPLPYADFARLLSRSAFAVTDSGGIQEEAPSLGLPFLVLRTGTERPEALGRWGRLAGVEPERVEREIVRLAAAPRRISGRNPFGDGRAAERVAAALRHWRGLGPRPADFR